MTREAPVGRWFSSKNAAPDAKIFFGRALRAKSAYDFFHFTFETGDRDTTIRGQIAAAASDFVGLPYYNPPGGTKTCLNSKIARCDLTVRRRGEPPRTLSTRHRAAFEILTDLSDHGVPVLAVPSSSLGDWAR